MTLVVDDHGEGNSVECADPAQEQLRGRVLFTGNNNRLVIGGGTVIQDCHIECGSNCAIAIGSHFVAHAMFIYLAADSSVEISDGVSFNARVRLLAHESSRIGIGSLSLFASDVDVTTSDMHSILDAETGARINPAQDITIGERVWVGQRALILKGAEIGADSVIAAGAIVSGSIPAGVIAAGIPARVVRTGVRWDRRLL